MDSAGASSSGNRMPVLPPPPPRVPDAIYSGPYAKGKTDEDDKGKGKASPSAMWMAGQGQSKVPTGWKNYMVPLLGVSCIDLMLP